MMRNRKSIPFEFVIDALDAAQPVIRPMFGCHALYIGEKIYLILRKNESFDADNGVWIATSHEHHESLKKKFPNLKPIHVLGAKGGWQMIPEEADDFEESVMVVCDMILKRDPRIGRTPKPRKPKKQDY